MQTRLFLVRHGEARGNVERVFHGYTDSDLTENGKQQVQRAVKRLENEIIDCFYSSDLKRARQTAEAIAELRGLSVKTDERLREINGGLWENVPWDDLPARFPESYMHWVDTPYLLQMPDGEGMQAFYDRLVEAVNDIIRLHTGQTICIASHGTAIRVLCCYFKGLPLSALLDVDWCDNAAITEVLHDYNGFRIIVEGDNSHLADISTVGKQAWWKKEQERRKKSGCISSGMEI